MIETLTNGSGETVATLTWRDRDNAEVADIDSGEIVRYAGGNVTVRLQNRDTGRVREYHHDSVVDAWYSLGLTPATDGRPRGIDGWLEMCLMPGTAGRD